MNLLVALWMLVAQGHDIQTLSPAVKARMTGVSWHQGCPVPLEDLRQLQVTYRDFSNRKQHGILVVNKEVAREVSVLFRKLLEQGFQIERITPVDEYQGNDDASMAANNTSAFNCRDTTGRPGVFSNHSWGRAIDINPLTNPYVKGETVLPPEGRKYLDRTQSSPGSIRQEGYAVRIFEAAGWTWGGRWGDRKDYQHFEKPKR